MNQKSCLLIFAHAFIFISFILPSSLTLAAEENQTILAKTYISAIKVLDDAESNYAKFTDKSSWNLITPAMAADNNSTCIIAGWNGDLQNSICVLPANIKKAFILSGQKEIQCNPVYFGVNFEIAKPEHSSRWSKACGDQFISKAIFASNENGNGKNKTIESKLEAEELTAISNEITEKNITLTNLENGMVSLCNHADQKQGTRLKDISNCEQFASLDAELSGKKIWQAKNVHSYEREHTERKPANH